VRRDGLFGVLPAAVATPLALVLNELIGNAVEHGLAGRAGTVTVIVERGPSVLRVRVLDPVPTEGLVPSDVPELSSRVRQKMQEALDAMALESR